MLTRDDDGHAGVHGEGISVVRPGRDSSVRRCDSKESWNVLFVKLAANSPLCSWRAASCRRSWYQSASKQTQGQATPTMDYRGECCSVSHFPKAAELSNMSSFEARMRIGVDWLYVPDWALRSSLKSRQSATVCMAKLSILHHCPCQDRRAAACSCRRGCLVHRSCSWGSQYLCGQPCRSHLTYFKLETEIPRE